MSRMAEEINSYVRKRLAAGIDRGVIRKELVEAGWSSTDISFAFIESSHQPVKPYKPPVSNSALDNLLAPEVFEGDALSPLFMGVSVFILFGGAYLKMRSYLRFFAAFVILVVLGMFRSTPLVVIGLMAVFVDTVYLTIKWNHANSHPPKLAAPLAIGIVVLVIYQIGAIVYLLHHFASTFSGAITPLGIAAGAAYVLIEAILIKFFFFRK